MLQIRLTLFTPKVAQIYFVESYKKSKYSTTLENIKNKIYAACLHLNSPHNKVNTRCPLKDHILLKKPAALFQYIRPFCGHEALKD